MAIEKLQLKSGEVRYRAIWVNPLTKKKESKSFSDKLDALEHDLLIKRRIKEDPTSFGKREESDGSFGELAWDYIAASQMTDSSKEHAYIVLQTTIIPVIGEKQASSLTKKDMAMIKKACIKKGNKQNTINRKISIVKAILNWAVEEGIIKENPIAGYKCPRGSDQEIKPPTTEERDLLWSNAAEHLKRAIVLSTGIGVRVGASELLGILWSDIDFTESTLTVRSAAKNKNMQLRIIDLNPSMISLLKGWHQADSKAGVSHVIHYNGKPISTIKKAWEGAKRRAKIERRIRPYDMRHYFVTEAIKAGADLKAVAEIVGHSDMTMIMKYYQHTVRDQRKFAVNTISMPKAIPNGNNDGNNGGN